MNGKLDLLRGGHSAGMGRRTWFRRPGAPRWRIPWTRLTRVASSWSGRVSWSAALLREPGTHWGRIARRLMRTGARKVTVALVVLTGEMSAGAVVLAASGHIAAHPQARVSQAAIDLPGQPSAGGQSMNPGSGPGAAVPGAPGASWTGSQGTGGPSPAAPPSGRPPAVTTGQVAPLRRIIPPDLMVVVPDGMTPGELATIKKLRQVRNVITMDGGMIRFRTGAVNVLNVNVLGVDPGQFRSWTPLVTAANESVWLALVKGGFVLSDTAQAQLGFNLGSAYQLVAATQPWVTLGAAAPLGIPGVEALVNQKTGEALGLVHDVAAMINAPGASLATLMDQVRGVLGAQATMYDLRAQPQPQPQSRQLPAGGAAQSGRPATYLELYKQSAADYCPGLSWTVLAAIGQIESDHGQNDGPSSAGALGPMQFLPSTWKIWGIAGFGDTTANIMDPYDAVPSAARYLCAAGAPGNLYGAIYAYNHADWYVREVLALAQQYASDYS